MQVASIKDYEGYKKNMLSRSVYFYYALTRIEVIKPNLSHYFFILALFFTNPFLHAQQTSISGDLKQWHTITLTFNGPAADERGNPNPFLDYRLQVTFTNGAQRFTIPGYFAADGDAANTGATKGNKWRVHFAPNLIGTWNYTVSFRQGSNVAVSLDPNSGNPVASLNGLQGTFQVQPTDKAGIDFRAKGRLIWDNAHYWRFQGSNKYFIKGGLDSPENFFGCTEFDNTGGNRTHDWGKHKRDWRVGDPTWKNGLGKGIIGALNYLAAEGLNSVGPITMAVKGDVSGIYPFVSSNERERFDCSRLDQWQITVDHANKNGIHIQFKLSEHENYNLEGTNLNNRHKVYYREMVARFGHYLGVSWNIGEEFGTSGNPYNQFARELAGYLDAVNPFPQNITIHNWGGRENQVFEPQMGNNSSYTGTSLQGEYYRAHRMALEMRSKSAARGKPWIIAHDEQPPFNKGVPPDGQTATNPASPNQGQFTQDDVRKEGLWGNMMAGGAGMEWFWGTDWSGNQTDFEGDDYRSRDRFWDYVRHALFFFETYLPFHEMENANNLIGNNSNSNDKFCFAKEGEIYAIYLPDGGSTNLNLSGAPGSYEVKWYNPREGGALLTGNVTKVSGGGNVSIGNSPSSSDWVALVKREGVASTGPQVSVIDPLTNQAFEEGDSVSLSAEVVSAGRSITGVTFFANNQVIGTDPTAPYTIEWPSVASGTYQITAEATDASGNSGISSPVVIVVNGTTDNGGNGGGTTNCEVPFVEKDGILIIEVENTTLSEGWEEKTDAPGFTGASYIEYVGPNYLGNGGNSPLEYKIQINQAGTYRFNYRTKVGRGDDTSEHNDSWVAFPDAEFYGQLDGTPKKYPAGKGSPVLAASDNGWVKAHSYGTLDWTYRTKVNDHYGYDPFIVFPTPGVYTVQLSGRSNGHLLDRMVLYHEDVSSESALDDDLGETLCDGSGSPTNGLPSVQISSPGNGDSFSIGDQVNIIATASPSEGTQLTKVVFYQGSTQLGEDTTPPYLALWEPSSPGNYSLTAVAFDDQGNQKTSRPISVTVLTADAFHIIPGKIEAEAYSDMSGIQTEASGEGTDNIGWFDQGDWVDYQVDVQVDGNYDVSFRVGSENTEGSFQLQQNGSTLATINVPNTGSYQTYTDVVVNNIPMTAGKQTIRLYSVTQQFNINHFTFSTDAVPPPPVDEEDEEGDDDENPSENDTAFITLLAPVNNSQTTEIFPIFTWSVSDPDTVAGYVFSLNGAVRSTSSSTTYQWEDTLELGDYTWRVRPKFTSGGYGEWSETFTFTVIEEDTISSTPVDSSFAMRINVGGPAYTAPNGDTFIADAYSFGTSYIHDIGDQAIAGTDLDLLYQSERWGEDFSFAIPTGNGTFSITLHFAEIYWDISNARIFDVDIENGSELLEKMDIHQEVGSKAAMIKTFEGIVVEDGILHLDLFAYANNAQLAAIEITGKAAKATQVSPDVQGQVIRINTGGDQYTTLSGETFVADQYYVGSSLAYAISDPISGTSDDVLYQSERYGVDFSYQIPVVNDTFDVILHFAEIFWTESSRRLFSVGIEGEPVIAALDLVDDAGSRQAHRKVFQDVIVTDGALSIDFSTITDNAKISAIEILSAGILTDINIATQDPLNDFINLSNIGEDPTGLIQVFKVFPNPVRDHVWISLEGDLTGAFQIGVYDFMGREITSYSEEKTDFSEKFEFSTDMLTTGMYFIRIQYNDTILSKRVLKR